MRMSEMRFNRMRSLLGYERNPICSTVTRIRINHNYCINQSTAVYNTDVSVGTGRFSTCFQLCSHSERASGEVNKVA
jgi:hypothetical protein